MIPLVAITGDRNDLVWPGRRPYCLKHDTHYSKQLYILGGVVWEGGTGGDFLGGLCQVSAAGIGQDGFATYPRFLLWRVGARGR